MHLKITKTSNYCQTKKNKHLHIFLNKKPEQNLISFSFLFNSSSFVAALIRPTYLCVSLIFDETFQSVNNSTLIGFDNPELELT